MSESVLRHYWYPVATADEVTDKPQAVTLLDERLVLYRARGCIAALKDLCIHRGTPLSLGWVDDGTLVCAYHGWAYGPDGACVRIPSLPPEQGIPRRARATSYHAQERYGLIWVCLDEPRRSIPDLRGVDDPSYHTFFNDGGVWNTSAGRMVDNFADVAHFPWVHPGINGTRDNPRTPSFAVRRRGDELEYAMDLPVPSKGLGWGVAEHRHRIILPFTIQLIRSMPGGEHCAVVSLAVSPISRKRIRRFLFISRNYDLDKSDDQFGPFIQAVSEQDRRIIEHQRPEALPVDLREELHLKGPDAASLAYRRLLAEIGVAEP